MNRRLDFKMTDAFKRIWDVHQLQKLPLRTAAYVIAMQSGCAGHHDPGL